MASFFNFTEILAIATRLLSFHMLEEKFQLKQNKEDANSHYHINYQINKTYTIPLLPPTNNPKRTIPIFIIPL